MKKSICNFIIVIVSLAPLSTVQSREYQKKINKEFSISSDAIIDIESRHGNVNFVLGNQDKVTFDILITVDADSEKKAQRILDGIDVDFDASSRRVSATTELDVDSGGGSWKGWFGGNWNQSISFDIEYTVTLPATAKILIDHAFGDVIIPSMNNDLEIDMKHGNARIGDITGDAIIDLKHGEIDMGDAANLDLEFHHSSLSAHIVKHVEVEMSHSDFEIHEATEMDIESSHSDITIEKVQRLDSDGQFDDLEIEWVLEIEVEGQFSDINIDWLDSQANFDLQHGELEIENVAKQATLISIDGQHSSVSLDLQHSFSFDFEGEHVKPKFRNQPNYTHSDDESHSYEYEGSYGSDPKLRLMVDMEHGSFRVGN